MNPNLVEHVVALAAAVAISGGLQTFTALQSVNAIVLGAIGGMVAATVALLVRLHTDDVDSE